MLGHLGLVALVVSASALVPKRAHARQLPERYEYHPIDALQKPTELASKLALEIQDAIGSKTVLDRTLVEACERLAHDKNMTPRDAMRASGVSDAFALPVRYRSTRGPSIQPVLHVLKTEVRHARVSHFGVAVHTHADGYDIALLFVRRGAWIGRFPTQFTLGQRYVIDGRLTKGLKNPRLLIASPKASVREYEPSASHGVFWSHISFNSGPGRYIIEVQAEDEFGTQVLNLMEVYASAPGSPRQVPVVRLRPRESRPRSAEVAASRAVRLVNRSRQVYRLPPLKLSRELSSEATRHAKDMAIGGFFGHDSPRRGGLAKRLQSAGLQPRLALENIAIGLSPDAVHAELLRSPSHLRNILDPQVTHIGVGAYRRTVGETQPVFTFSQIFARH